MLKTETVLYARQTQRQRQRQRQRQTSRRWQGRKKVSGSERAGERQRGGLEGGRCRTHAQLQTSPALIYESARNVEGRRKANEERGERGRCGAESVDGQPRRNTCKLAMCKGRAGRDAACLRMTIYDLWRRTHAQRSLSPYLWQPWQTVGKHNSKLTCMPGYP